MKLNLLFLNKRIYICLLSLFSILTSVRAQIISFENGVPSELTLAGKGALSTTNEYYKIGKNSLEWNWKQNDLLILENKTTLPDASTERYGGVYMWIYNENPQATPLTFAFYNGNSVRCAYSFNLNYTGWRCMLVRFRDDMNHTSSTINKMVIQNRHTGGGTIRLDYIEFQENVSWERTADLQQDVAQSSQISDFVSCYNTKIPVVSNITDAELQAIEIIKEKVKKWLLWDGKTYQSNQILQIRKSAMNSRINMAKRNFNNYKLSLRSDKSVKGPGLYNLSQTKASDGTILQTFRVINESTLLPLAYDAALNNSETSKKSVAQIYDWYADQGWAAGSGLGILRFEKLRSAGYFHSLFLMGEYLTEKQLERELETLHWFALVGYTAKKPNFTSENTDIIRTMAIAKLYHALLQPDKNKAVAHMRYYNTYLQNSFDFGKGFSDMIKPDYSGYHHRGPYLSAYYPDGLYSAVLINYLLHGTSFALPTSTSEHLVKAMEVHLQTMALYDVPLGTKGRFPLAITGNVQMIPAIALLAATDQASPVLLNTLKKRWNSDYNSNHSLVKSYIASHSTEICHKQTLGEIGITIQALEQITGEISAESYSSNFLPYSGMLIHRSPDIHVSVKGFSKFVWDFEATAGENNYGRYLNYGQIEITDLNSERKNNTVMSSRFNWNYIPGTTSKLLSNNALSYTGGGNKQRNFSDKVFLGGVADVRNSMFAMDMHDNTFDRSLYAKKTVFAFGDTLLCLGSNIRCGAKEQLHTTLVQQKTSSSEKVFFNGGQWNNQTISAQKNSRLQCNMGHGYVVVDGSFHMNKNVDMLLAYLKHENKTNDSYAYYILPKTTTEILSGFVVPVSILSQNEYVHAVKHNTNNLTMMAVFNSSKPVDVGYVKSVNTPVSIMYSETENELKMTIADPDMRRPSGINIDRIGEDIVYTPSGKFWVEVELNGAYTLNTAAEQVIVEKSYNKTIIKVELQHGIQRQLILSKDNANNLDLVTKKIMFIHDQSSESIYLQTDEVEKIFDVSLFSIDGRRITQNKNMHHNDRIYVGNIQGMYLITIEGERTQKIIL